MTAQAVVILEAWNEKEMCTLWDGDADPQRQLHSLLALASCRPMTGPVTNFNPFASGTASTMLSLIPHGPISLPSSAAVSFCGLAQHTVLFDRIDEPGDPFFHCTLLQITT